jgi:YHS domain-containing protein
MGKKMNGFLVFDIEADGLYNDYYKQNATKIWCICAKDHAGKEFFFVNREHLEQFAGSPRVVRPLEDFAALVKSGYKAMICHNQIDYDLRMLRKFLGLEYSIKPDSFDGHKIEIIDSLLDSKWLNPKRQLPWGCPGSVKSQDGGKSRIIGPHGLEAWGYRVAKKKPEIEDWSTQDINVYLDRCIEDVRINWDTFKCLNEEMAFYFKGSSKLADWQHNRKKAVMPIYIEHAFKQDMVEQRDNGVPFNEALALELIPKFDAELNELRTKIESHLPSVPIPESRLKDWKFPAKPFLGTGEPAKNLLKFVEKWNGTLEKVEGKWTVKLVVEGKEETYTAPFPGHLRTTEQMTVESDDLPTYIMDHYVWKPFYWNYKIDPVTKRKVRDENKQLIKTTPRFKDAQSGRLCPHLDSLEVPFIRDVLRYRTIKHRRQTIESACSEEKGWLNHPRLQIDKRIPADMDTIGAATARVTHKILCNVPKADDDVLYGAELRSLFWNGGDSDWYFLGYDAAALEARLEGAEAFPFDNGEYAEILTT